MAGDSPSPRCRTTVGPPDHPLGEHRLAVKHSPSIWPTPCVAISFIRGEIPLRYNGSSCRRLARCPRQGRGGDSSQPWDLSPRRSGSLLSRGVRITPSGRPPEGSLLCTHGLDVPVSVPSFDTPCPSSRCGAPPQSGGRWGGCVESNQRSPENDMLINAIFWPSSTVHKAWPLHLATSGETSLSRSVRPGRPRVSKSPHC